MRAFSKILTGSIVAGAALALSACGGNTETTADNATVTDLNSTDMMDGTMSDNMTAVDGAMGNDTMMMSNDSMMSNDTMMMSNEAGMTNAM
ncbi:hypothetical protein ASE73_12680 [Sphingomonas sp. Leaf24]|uniref:hypothetical protein n=1 Tax=unclassified Sphingomonas TaxID=196159 RepID=UPI0006FEC00E|nr:MULTISPECIES: hypothetical protein [unclassified Sphingomonas]KQM12851.1 hypothetical protein ASE50_10860 [Sphingomonas sp. Leaf5]KQM41507.1 hypothetical protein ASE59_04470 [Sphingomonas sp. Leaf10]KQM94488.1 hypothetical protein ASE73_12680 [Sphingomonas sp. Leaf24]KQM95450.1 hypothetical protein ASE70_01705 [Sphingomonas sp. Leaf22]KQN70923.1 hypothetical protein ASE91_07050 [Sphingomonas sp. Leaf62]